MLKYFTIIRSIIGYIIWLRYYWIIYNCLAINGVILPTSGVTLHVFTMIFVYGQHKSAKIYSKSDCFVINLEMKWISEMMFFFFLMIPKMKWFVGYFCLTNVSLAMVILNIDQWRPTSNWVKNYAFVYLLSSIPNCMKLYAMVLMLTHYRVYKGKATSKCQKFFFKMLLI